MWYYSIHRFTHIRICMLASLAKLLKSLKENDSKIFDDEINHDAVKDTLAVLMMHVAMADKKTTEKENKKMVEFFQQEFNMNTEETHELFESVVENMNELEKYIDTLSNILANNIAVKARIMQHLNNLIICDGCVDEEYHVFETIKTSLI